MTTIKQVTLSNTYGDSLLVRALCQHSSNVNLDEHEQAQAFINEMFQEVNELERKECLTLKQAMTVRAYWLADYKERAS